MLSSSCFYCSHLPFRTAIHVRRTISIRTSGRASLVSTSTYHCCAAGVLSSAPCAFCFTVHIPSTPFSAAPYIAPDACLPPYTMFSWSTSLQWNILACFRFLRILAVGPHFRLTFCCVYVVCAVYVHFHPYAYRTGRFRASVYCRPVSPAYSWISLSCVTVEGDTPSVHRTAPSFLKHRQICVVAPLMLFCATDPHHGRDISCVVRQTPSSAERTRIFLTTSILRKRHKTPSLVPAYATHLRPFNRT